MKMWKSLCVAASRAGTQKGNIGFVLLLLFSYCCCAQQGRFELGLNQGWYFAGDTPSDNLEAPAKWQRVDLPHTWNAEDVADDVPGFFRGVFWYRRQLVVGPELSTRKLLLVFEGVNQVATVYVNGKLAGTHRGGYTRFGFPVEAFLDFSPGAINTLLVRVDNRPDADIPPLAGDFSFLGGIYRDVKLVVYNAVHFAFDHGANYVYITTPAVSAKEASVSVKSRVCNQSGAGQKLVVRTQVKDATGRVVATHDSPVRLEASGAATVTQLLPTTSQPNLWSPDQPYCYTVITSIRDARSGALLDEVANPLGFRWFRFDAQTGFYLNDQPLKLIGASRHQDFKGMGNALPRNYHERDVQLLKDMGANFLRVAHYPQDPAVLQACDRLGLLASVEVPIVSAITESPAFDQQCKDMQLEMIRQHANHPSVIIWAYMNEILLEPRYPKQSEQYQSYVDHITRLAGQLEALTRAEDPYRYTLIPNHAWYDDYRKAGLTDIPMIVGWNLYQGWYGGNTSEFGAFLDRFHRDYPHKPVMVTEYGADADPRIHAADPVKFDKSVEYALNFHHTYLDAIFRRPFVAAGMIWNLADFSSEARAETMPHVNNKGMLTMDRKPKDLYYFYQAHLLKTPFVAVTEWRNRSGWVDSGTAHSVQPVSVFSNAASVELFWEGRSLGVQTPVRGRFIWEVPLRHGANTIEAVIHVGDRQYRDQAVIDFELITPTLSGRHSAQQVNVLLGASRMFTDDKGLLWLPDQPYAAGKWGHVAGRPFVQPNTLQQYGSNKNIRHTENDPIYQTQQVGIREYRMDVPDGVYELTLHFAELTETARTAELAYNLTGSILESKAEERVFDIQVNGVAVFGRFNMAKRYGVLTAGFETIRVSVENGTGICLRFDPVVGEPALNGLQLTRLY